MKKILLFLLTLSVCASRAQTTDGFVVCPLVSADCIASVNVVSIEESEQENNFYIVGNIIPFIMQQIVSSSNETDVIEAIENKKDTTKAIIYDEMGRRLRQMKSGINIIKNDDGTITKAFSH